MKICIGVELELSAEDDDDEALDEIGNAIADRIANSLFALPPGSADRGIDDLLPEGVLVEGWQVNCLPE